MCAEIEPIELRQLQSKPCIEVISCLARGSQHLQLEAAWTRAKSHRLRLPASLTNGMVQILTPPQAGRVKRALTE